MKIDWRSKLTSRKFWLALVGFITPIMVALKCTDSEIITMTSIVMGGASLIAYIIGEGLVDSNRAQSETSSTSVITTIKESSSSQSDSLDGDNSE